ncbi:MAG: Asp23/Gls24 family envelope stress response protein [Erysipelotrichaceae bacterium]|nr:Asp23/Gls24 family envelope stress response protein [Erysipelotrichaceae bacterium]
MELKRNEIGTYTISEKAFKDIAAIACSNVKNVYPAKKDNEFVECKFNKNGEPEMNVSIRVKQGSDIVKLCNKIQDEINEAVLLMTGIECKKIDIDIQGFESVKEKK